jgi:hypothetical protein
MDPFTLITGTVGLLDVCMRVVGYLNNVRVSAGKVEAEIKALSLEINTLLAVYHSLQDFWTTKHKANLGPRASGEEEIRIDSLWNGVITNLKECQVTVGQLEELLKEIIGKDGDAKVSGKIDGIRKQLRKQSKDSDFPQIRQRLSNLQGSLQLLLTALNL